MEGERGKGPLGDGWWEGGRSKVSPHPETKATKFLGEKTAGGERRKKKKLSGGFRRALGQIIYPQGLGGSIGNDSSTADRWIAGRGRGENKKKKPVEHPQGEKARLEEEGGYELPGRNWEEKKKK